MFSNVLLLWAVLEGLGVILGQSWGGFRRSWGRLEACWGRLGGRVGRGLAVLERLRETLGSFLVSYRFLNDFGPILVSF